MPRHFTDRDLALFRRKNGEPDLPLPPKPRKRDNEEHRIQASLILWWHHACAGFGVPEQALFAVGNGGHRSPITGAIMKREGVRAGTSDLILLVKRGGFGGLCIEMKKPGGVISGEQCQFLAMADAQGYRSRVCYSTASAAAEIGEYLKL